MEILQYVFGIMLTVGLVAVPCGLNAADRDGSLTFWSILCSIGIGILLCGMKSYFTYGVLSAVLTAIPVFFIAMLFFFVAASSECEGILVFTFVIDVGIYVWLLVEAFGDYAMYFA